ncbi:MAG: DUF998 domain-containing protein [Stackebrandtia sp.]
MTKTRLPTVAAILGACVGIASFATLHLLLAGTVDPLRDPVSAYALVPVGDGLFAAGALGYAVSCAVLALPGREGARRYTAARALSAVTSVMFVLVVAFPTDAGPAVSSIGGQIHRYAAGAAFIGMTLLGFARSRPGGAARGWTAVLTGLSAATLLLTTVNTFAPGLADGGAWRGAPQRILLVIHAVMLIVLALDRGRARNETADRSRDAARTRWAFWRQAGPQYLAGRPVVAAAIGERHTSHRAEVSLRSDMPLPVSLRSFVMASGRSPAKMMFMSRRLPASSWRCAAMAT